MKPKITTTKKLFKPRKTLCEVKNLLYYGQFIALSKKILWSAGSKYTGLGCAHWIIYSIVFLQTTVAEARTKIERGKKNYNVQILDWIFTFSNLNVWLEIMVKTQFREFACQISLLCGNVIEKIFACKNWTFWSNHTKNCYSIGCQ